MSFQIKIAKESDIELIEKMANVAFPHTYKEILKPDQISYMLGMMYSFSSLENQFKLGHVYFIAYNNETPVGYASVERQSDKIFHLQKIYVMPEWQGKGVGGIMFKRVVEYVKQIQPNQCKIELNVNRNNKAIEFYQHLGMRKVFEGDFNIGRGYQMNDYIMALDL